MKIDLKHFTKIEETKSFILYVEKGPYKDNKIHAIVYHKESQKAVKCSTSPNVMNLLTNPTEFAKKIKEKEK